MRRLLAAIGLFASCRVQASHYSERLALHRGEERVIVTLAWEGAETVQADVPVFRIVAPTIFELLGQNDADRVTLSTARGAASDQPLLASPWAPPGTVVEASFPEPDKIVTWSQTRRAASALACAATLEEPTVATHGVAPWFRAPGSQERAASAKERTVSRVLYPTDEACLENVVALLAVLPCRADEGLRELFLRLRRLPLAYSAVQISAFRDLTGARRPLRASFALRVDLHVHDQHAEALAGALRSRNVTVCPAASNTEMDRGEGMTAPDVGADGSFETPPLSQRRAGETATGAAPDRAQLVAWRAVIEKPGDLSSAVLRYSVSLPPSAHTGASFSLQDALPWYLRPVVSTITLDAPRNATPSAQLHLDPAVAPGLPAKLLLNGHLLPGEGVALSVELRKEFLTVDEFPPDASRGLDLPAAAVHCSHGGEGGAPSVLFLPGLLVRMPYPDASMPYNVITLSCTVVSFAFGTVWSVTTRRER